MKEGGIMNTTVHNKTIFFYRWLFLTLATSALLLPGSLAGAAAAQKDVSCKYDGNGTLTISGNGVLKEIAVGDRTEDDGVGIGVKRVIVEEGITEMEAYCLSGFLDMTDLELPDSLQKIGKQAFRGCRQLKKVKLPSGISEIPEGCFSGCRSLEEIVIPEGLTAIRKDALKSCERLKQLIVPESLTLWENPIANCPALKKVVNHGAQPLALDSCEGKKAWYVKGKKVNTLAPGETAVSKGKKFKIRYQLLGGKKTGNLPIGYRYGDCQKLTLHASKPGYALLGWYNPANKREPYYQTSISPSLAQDITLKPFWVKYELKNIKKSSICISINDQNAVVPFGTFHVRYSKNKDMSESEYCYVSSGSPKTIRKLQKNQAYYFEIAYTEAEADDDDCESIWVGKRSVVIKK